MTAMTVRGAVVGCLVVMLVAVLLPASRPPAEAAGCDPARPETCTLRQLAPRAGIRMGTTAEPSEVVPGPYAETAVREFTSLTPENALKWYTVQPTDGGYVWGPADAVVDFAAANGFEVRGHTLVWAQDTFTPAWVRAIDDPVTMRAELAEHVGAVVDRYEDRVRRWDVVNEPLDTLGTGPSDNVFARVLGPDWIAEVFALAAAADPTAELWLNEYGTDLLPGKHEALLALVRELLAEGVPLHGIGLQTHRLGPDGPDPAVFEAQLTDFTDLGLEVAVTELDVPVSPTDPDALAEQAEAYRRIVGSCLAVAGCVEVTTWGLTDASTWLDSLGLFPTPTRPLLFDDQFRPKPAYHAVRETLAAAAAGPPSTGPPSTGPSAPPAVGPARPVTGAGAIPTFAG